MLLELCLEHVRVLPAEEDRLVEAADRARDVDHLREPGDRLGVVFVRPGGAVVIGGEVGLETGHRTQEQDRVEIDVLQPLWVSGDAGDEALEVRALWSILNENGM